ncbi:carbohydrate ABC transporter membrane protein 1 (CUT1 family) [Asanoa ferruginea]|uniref:Carbohydrate ABC transporter membrane protein 1 (CUT1 family) n=1 Tax=Asanoa ferruginea TaxID=53367 RepID=A0A3D9ZYG0_9ACTN|nr:sugar ABC transporter permease [Asanoa ferruginea]REG01695.1 carbohydrate ABC transporter membrane protein 1 (CUT1 family) [Asanoa ferruginea]GIF51706.1 transporter [Asanoa ferruginea]HEV7711496.1 sugar ABC transporter permease [Asanoa sp.]
MVATRDKRPAAPEQRRRPARPLTRRQRENRAGLAYLSPTFIVVLVVVVVPILWTIMLAFQRIRLINIRRAGLFGEYTLRNFEYVFSSPGFWSSLWTTLVYTVGGTALSIIFGLIAALALRKRFPGRTLVRASVLLPYVAPVVAVTFVWEIMLSPQFGVANDWGGRFLGWDRPIAFLSQREYHVWGVDIPLALFTVIAFEAWRYFPFAFLFILARLQAVPKDLEEAATVDGAAPTQLFRHILLPQLGAVIALLSVLRFIMTFNKFDDVWLLTGGGAGTQVVSVRVYDFLTSRLDIGAAAAQGLVLAAGLVILLLVYLRFFAPKLDGES